MLMTSSRNNVRRVAKASTVLNWIFRKLIISPGYIANYGYTDGSGAYYIIMDTDKCDGCAKCIEACPENVFEVGEDDNDPLRDEPVARVRHDVRKNLKYICAPCISASGSSKPLCEQACEAGAIKVSIVVGGK